MCDICGFVVKSGDFEYIITFAKYCRRDGVMKTRLETNIDGCRLRLVLLFELALLT